MKKIFRNNRFMAIISLALLITGTALPAIARSTADSSNDAQVELKVVGSINDRSVFQLKIAGNIPNNFELIIRDIQGTTIYRESIKTETFSKKFLFDNEEPGDETIYLEVYNRRTRQSVTYEINRHYRSVLDVVVNELK